MPGGLSPAEETEANMLIDITQELFSCHVFPGDPPPKPEVLMSMKEGAVCNLSGLSMCAHNGTHVDAPKHFLDSGRTIDQLGLAPFVGPCYVARHEGDVLEEDARRIVQAAAGAGAPDRILVAGRATLTEEAARVLAAAGIVLYGNESQTVGPEEAPAPVHRILLGADCVLLEGAVLTGVQEGRYILSAAPLNLGGCEGAPCRAYLIRDESDG